MFGKRKKIDDGNGEEEERRKRERGAIKESWGSGRGDEGIERTKNRG